MVKVCLHLGWLVAFLVAVSIARPVFPRVIPPHHYELILPAGGTAAPTAEQALADDGAVRSERSTNLSHITGTARKIHMYIKNRYLQILPDGTVNGTSNDGSDYTILQRQSVKTGQLLVQSVATCLYLCMDSCGLLYGARNLTRDCIFNERFEQQRYITYSSSKYSNEKRTLYMALNKRGQPRKVQVPSKSSLGKLSSYSVVQLQTVSDERVKDLAERILRVRESLQKDPNLPSGNLASIILAQHPLRHHGYHHLCPQTRLLANEPEDSMDETGRDKFRCRRRKKRKKKKRRCRQGEEEGEQCQKGLVGMKWKKKCQEGEGEEVCQKRLEAAKRRRKSRNGEKKLKDVVKKNKKKLKNGKIKKKLVSDGEMDSVVERTADESQREVFTMTTECSNVSTILANSSLLSPVASTPNPPHSFTSTMPPVSSEKIVPVAEMSSSTTLTTSLSSGRSPLIAQSSSSKTIEDSLPDTSTTIGTDK